MADIKLTKPEAGNTQSIPAEAGALYVFDFPTSETAFAKDGDNLTITFTDGSQINLQNFYTEYNSENLPSFEVSGQQVDAQEFFTAMNEPDLIPAAGSGAGAAAAANNRYHEYSDSDLADGIDHLTRLDWNVNRGFEPEENFNSVGRNGDDYGYDRGTLVSDILNSGVITPLAPEMSSTTPITQPITGNPTPGSPTGSNPPDTAQVSYNFIQGSNPEIPPIDPVNYNIALVIDISFSMTQFRMDGTQIWNKYGELDNGSTYSKNLRCLKYDNNVLYTNSENMNGNYRATIDNPTDFSIKNLSLTVDEQGNKYIEINGILCHEFYYKDNNEIKTVSVEDFFKTRWDATIESIEKLLNEYNNHISEGGKINLEIIAFNGAAKRFEVPIYENKIDVETMMETLNKISPVGGTNYEAAFIGADQMLKECNNDYENKIVFLTDGNPTTNMFGGKISDTSDINTLRGLEFNYEDLIKYGTVSGVFNGEKYVIEYNADEGMYVYYNENDSNKYKYLSNGFPEHNNLRTDLIDWTAGLKAVENLGENVSVTIIGIGQNQEINIYGETEPKHLSDFGDFTYIDSAEKLEAALMGSVPAKPIPEIITGTIGNDIIFGDHRFDNLTGDDLVASVPDNPLHFDESQPGDMPDQIIGGEGNDIIYGQGGSDLLIGDGEIAKDATSLSTLGNLIDVTDENDVTAETITNAVKEMDSDALTKFANGLTEMETETDGNDYLFGGAGNDVLIGLGGNDYLNGGADQDIIYAGSGNDFIVYDPNDYLIDGGDGIDFMLAGNEDISLNKLLSNQNGEDANAPIVHDVEVLLKGVDFENLQTMEDVASKYGFTLGKDENGNDVLNLQGDKWKMKGPVEGDITTYTFGDTDVTLETNLTEQQPSSDDATIVLIQTMQNGV